MKNLIQCSMSLAVALLVSGCNSQDTAKPAGAATAPAMEVTADAPAPKAAPRLINWGPQTTQAGQAFQVQADGGSGMFFEFDSELPAAPVAVTFNGTPLTGLVAEGKVVTATIPPALLATPGTFEIMIVLPEGGPSFAPLMFTVEAPTK